MNKFDLLAKEVQACGSYALEAQYRITRTYKHDGSVLTATDITISERLIATIQKLFPDANIISEETITKQSSQPSFTFVIDPIDGTDVYSQGMPSWCIAVGVLNVELQPVGAYIAAPRWGIGTPEGLFLRLDPQDTQLPTLNGLPLQKQIKTKPIEQLTICSTSSKIIDFSKSSAKLRSFGSNILHILSPALFDLVQGTIFTPCYIWDIAPAHAIVAALGFELVYFSTGFPIRYDTALLSRETTSDIVLVGQTETIKEMRDSFSLK